MTKADELKRLDKFIASLGPNTYLGAWLAYCRSSVERDILSDLHPTPMLPAEAVRLAQSIVKDAEDKAHRLVASAEQDAARRRDDMTKQLRLRLDGVLRTLSDQSSELVTLSQRLT